MRILAIGNGIHPVVLKMLRHITHESVKISTLFVLVHQTSPSVIVRSYTLTANNAKLVGVGVHLSWRVKSRPIGERFSTNPSNQVATSINQPTHDGFHRGRRERSRRMSHRWGWWWWWWRRRRIPITRRCSTGRIRGHEGHCHRVRRQGWDNRKTNSN
jgi:hypothetical protein